MGEYSDFDLDRSTDQAWEQFQARLIQALPHVVSHGVVTMGVVGATDEATPSITFHATAESSSAPILVMEAISNAELGDAHQLSATQLTDMEALGWQPPSVSGPRPSPRFHHCCPSSQWPAAVEMATRTLREVYGAWHPVFLAPDQLAHILQPMRSREPIREMVVHTARDRDDLDRWVDQTLREMYGYDPFRDEQGDCAIRVGSTVVFVRTSLDAEEIVLFAVLVHDINGRSAATEILNDLNQDSRYGRFALYRDKVFVSMSLLARPYVAAHLKKGLRLFSELADGLDDGLAARLHGRTTYDHHDGT